MPSWRCVCAQYRMSVCRFGSCPDWTELQSAVTDSQVGDGEREHSHLWSMCVYLNPCPSPCVCACLCLWCVKWNERQRFRVAQGTWPSYWSDKGRAGQEGGMGIGPVMNEECEATDKVKHIRFVCISFLFSLIDSPLWYVCCLSALLHHRHPSIISESKNDGKFN